MCFCVLSLNNTIHMNIKVPLPIQTVLQNAKHEKVTPSEIKYNTLKGQILK